MTVVRRWEKSSGLKMATNFVLFLQLCMAANYPPLKWGWALRPVLVCSWREAMPVPGLAHKKPWGKHITRASAVFLLHLSRSVLKPQFPPAALSWWLSLPGTQVQTHSCEEWGCFNFDLEDSFLTWKKHSQNFAKSEISFTQLSFLPSAWLPFCLTS